MESYQLCFTLVLLINIAVVVATSDTGKDTADLPPVLRVLHQNQPETEAPAKHIRVKRQNGVIIDSIFQIPIQTLSAVNNLFKNSVLAFQSWRQGAGPSNQSASSASSALQYTGSNFGSSSYNGGSGYYPNYNGYSGINNYRPPRKYQSSAAITGDLPVKNDGSSYRI